jgi:hypothetical protein
MAMSVSAIPSGQPQMPPASSVEAKRAALQTALLRKSLELQDSQATQMQRETEGKGQILDLRV